MKFRQVPMGAWNMLSYFWPVFSYPLVHFSGEKTILPYFSSLSMVAISVSFPEVRNRKETESGLGHYDWWQEVPGIKWISRGVAAAVVHQGCPVPICDLDKVACAGGDINSTANPNSKVGELQPQYLPTLHYYGLRFVEVGRIESRVVW